MNEVSLQSSFDNGESFTERARLSQRRFDSRVGFGSERNLPDLGSRLGLVSDDSRARAVWTDTRSGTEISNKQDIYEAEVSFGAGAAKALELGLRLGGIALIIAGLTMLAARKRRVTTA